MKKLTLALFCIMGTTMSAQEVMTPELLWQLGRVSPLGISKDGKAIIYKVSTPDMQENKSNSKVYSLPINGGNPTEIKEFTDLLVDKNKSSDGNWTLSHKEVKINPVLGKDFYPELKKSDVYVYDALDYRHWDSWNEGKHNHVFITNAD